MKVDRPLNNAMAKWVTFIYIPESCCRFLFTDQSLPGRDVKTNLDYADVMESCHVISIARIIVVMLFY
jgi:hypothetical protein